MTQQMMAQTTWTITVLTNDGGEWRVNWTNAKGELIGKTDWCQSSNAAFIQMGDRQSLWLSERLAEAAVSGTRS
jgi:hypothetical protein